MIQSIRVGTYNVLIPRDDKIDKSLSSWAHRKDAVVATLNEHFDLVGLQECSTKPEHGQALFLEETLAQAGWTGYLPWHENLFPDDFHERLPIFWRRDRFTLLEAGQLLLSKWTPQELEELPILEARYSSFVKLRTEAGAILWCYTLHLQHHREGAPESEVSKAHSKQEEGQRRLAEHVAAHRLPGETVVIAGDFNTVELSPCLATAGLQEVDTLTAELKEWHHDSFHDWQKREDGLHIDHMLVSGPAEVKSASLILSEASDHYPLVSELVLA